MEGCKCLSGLKYGDLYQVTLQFDNSNEEDWANKPQRLLTFEDKNGVFELKSNIIDWLEDSDPEQSFEVDLGEDGKAWLYTYQGDNESGAHINIVKNGNLVDSTDTSRTWGDDGWIMNKGYSQLKNSQKMKISDWMFEAYKKQIATGISDEEAARYVSDKIDEAEIWVLNFNIEKKYKSMKSRFKNRLAAEKVPQHIYQMESLLDKAKARLDMLEKMIAEYREFQSEIQKLDEYYTSQQWKDDFAMDEASEFPDKLKRGVLSEDGIYNLLERNKEMMDWINEFYS